MSSHAFVQLNHFSISLSSCLPETGEKFSCGYCPGAESATRGCTPALGAESSSHDGAWGLRGASCGAPSPRPLEEAPCRIVSARLPCGFRRGPRWTACTGGASELRTHRSLDTSKLRPTPPPPFGSSDVAALWWPRSLPMHCAVRLSWIRYVILPCRVPFMLCSLTIPDHS
jgi:hypothetical protein